MDSVSPKVMSWQCLTLALFTTCSYATTNSTGGGTVGVGSGTGTSSPPENPLAHVHRLPAVDTNPTSFSRANAISLDGSVVVGRRNDFGFVAIKDQLVDIGGPGLSYAEAYGTSTPFISNGEAVVAGWMFYGSRGLSRAFRWTQRSGLVDIGTFDNTDAEASSIAYGISADGEMIVGVSSGKKANGDGFNHAFRWSSSQGMADLGTLGGSMSQGFGISGSGDVVVGMSYLSGDTRLHGFRWTTASGMTDLGTLGGAQSVATAVSADGNTIVGYAHIAQYPRDHAFRWTLAGGMQDLGTFNPDSTGSESWANAVSSDGEFVVGQSNSVAFRWSEATGMISIGEWLARAGVANTGFHLFENALGVTASGNTVVGWGRTGIGIEAFIARVGPEGAGVVGVSDLHQSLSQSVAVSSQLDGIGSMALNGAHHRTLMELGSSNGNHCAWASGDLGVVHRRADGWAGIGEIGVCRDLDSGDMRVGIGLGMGYKDLQLSNGGRSRVDGQYVIGEVDWRKPDEPLLVSALATYGQWDVDLKRGYAIAGTSASTGRTDASTFTSRIRADWKDAFKLGKAMFSPRIAYTFLRSQILGYREQGGSAPASFRSQSHEGGELRMGVTANVDVDAVTRLLGHVEYVHRSDGRSSPVIGTVSALGVGIPFKVQGVRIGKDWMRVGADIDRKVAENRTVNVSTFVGTSGQDADITVAISYRAWF